MDDAPPPNPARHRTAPLGRLLAVTCFVPVLAMIVLGARQFDPARGLRVQEVTQEVNGVGVAPDPLAPQDRPDPARPNASADSALASVSVTNDVRLTRTRRVVMMQVTAYCPCALCCGTHSRGITASGKPVSYNGGRFVAADTRDLPFRTKLRVPGYDGGNVVEVMDKGGAIKGDKLDVFFPDHASALRWGRQTLPVEVVEDVGP